MPERIKWLLVAEAPPRDESRFIYFTNVREQDSLFIETMHALYQDIYPKLFLAEKRNIKGIREMKHAFLIRFMEDGFFLIDAVDRPIKENENNEEVVRTAAPELAEKILNILDDATNIILIKSSVYAIKRELERLGVENIVNHCMIPFPGSGHQTRYRLLLRETLERSGWEPPI